MAKPSWGKKLKCQSCGAVFYDMTVEKPACPKCKTVYTPVVKGRRVAAIPVMPSKKPTVSVVDGEENTNSETLDDDLDAALNDDDEDEGLIEDTADLDDDDDDMAEIKEHVEADLDN